MKKNLNIDQINQFESSENLGGTENIEKQQLLDQQDESPQAKLRQTQQQFNIDSTAKKPIQHVAYKLQQFDEGMQQFDEKNTGPYPNQSSPDRDSKGIRVHKFNDSDGSPTNQVIGSSSTSHVPYFGEFEHNNQKLRQSNLRIHQSNDNMQLRNENNRTTDLNGFDKLNLLKRLRKIQVRKLLKFENGMLVANSQSVLDAIKQGAENVPQVTVKPAMSSKNVTKSLASGGGTPRNGKCASFATPKVGSTSGFNLQNRLVQKQNTRGQRNGGTAGTFQSVLYRLSCQQSNNDIHLQTDAFLKEDLYTSPKYLDVEKDAMNIRYDERSKVVSRSICGTKGTFQDHIKKQQDKLIAEKKQKAYNKAASRRSTKLSVRSKSSTRNVFGGGMGGDTSRSMISSARFGQQEVQIMEAVLGEDKVSEEASQDIEASESTVLDCVGGITVKQMKAAQKLSLYEKGWQRQNNLLYHRDDRKKASLIDQQRSYQSPRKDCIQNFYQSTQRSIEESADTRRAGILERAHIDENQKFCNEQARKDFLGGLRSENYMYVPTTKNLATALYCRVSTSQSSNNMRANSMNSSLSRQHLSRRQPRNTGMLLNCQSNQQYELASLNFAELGSGLESGTGSGPGSGPDSGHVSSRREAQHLLALTQPVQINKQAMPASTTDGQQQQQQYTRNSQNLSSVQLGSERRRVRKNSTQIFDGAVLNTRNITAARTYKSKSFASDANGRFKSGYYLPKVAVAIRMHTKAKENLHKQRELEEQIDVGLDY